MMKSIINKSLLAMLALLPLFTACQSDPEVGTPLYPVEEVDQSPKIYVYNGSLEGNITESTVVKTPAGLFIPTDTLRFYVQLTRSVTQDVVVGVEQNTEKAAAFDSEAEQLGSDAVTFITRQVTIPAGSNRSAEEIVAVINDASAIQNLQEYGVLALTLTTTSNVKVAQDYNTYYWKFYKTERNVHETTGSGLTDIPYEDYTLTATGGSYLDRLHDGVSTGYSYCILRVSSNANMVFSFEEAHTVKAFACITPSYSFYLSYNIGEVKVETSDDGENWTHQGTMTLEKQTLTGVWSFVEFYAPVTAKYFRYTPLSAVGTTYGNCYLSEVKLCE